MAGRGSPSRSCADDRRQELGLDCNRAIFSARIETGSLPVGAHNFAADVQRGIGRDDSAELRLGPVAAGRNLRFDGAARRLHLSSLRALGLGWRMAGAAWLEQRTRPRL